MTRRPPHVRPVTPATRHRWREDHPEESARLALELVAGAVMIALAFFLAFVLLPVMQP